MVLDNTQKTVLTVGVVVGIVVAVVVVLIILFCIWRVRSQKKKRAAEAEAEAKAKADAAAIAELELNELRKPMSLHVEIDDPNFYDTEWKVLQNTKGETFYFNKKTMTSTWSKPVLSKKDVVLIAQEAEHQKIAICTNGNMSPLNSNHASTTDEHNTTARNTTCTTVSAINLRNSRHTTATRPIESNSDSPRIVGTDVVLC